MKIVGLLLTVFAGLAYATCSNYGSDGVAPSYDSVPVPPCPKNYLFSCQPNLQPSPCAQAAAGYGSAGAYTEHVPAYIGAPQHHQQQQQYQGNNYYSTHDLSGYQGIQGYQGS